MQKSFQKAIGIACFVALMQCLVLIMTCCHSGFNANKNTIHYSDVEKIHIGMPLDSVVLVLGMPYIPLAVILEIMIYHVNVHVMSLT